MKTYLKWCIEEGYNDEEKQKSLLRTLNHIGSIVYFDKPLLDKYQILNPEWITTGAYTILTSEITKKNQGDLSWRDLKEIFKEEKSIFSNKSIKIKYTEEDFPFIIELMMEYRLIQKKPNQNHSYLVPPAFGEKPIGFAYKRGRIDRRHYRIQFNSPFEMLIMHRFIAKNIIHAVDKNYWHSGIYIKHIASNTFALLETNQYSYRIDCWIHGDNIRGLWEIIRSDFREIFKIYNNFHFSEEVLYKKDEVSVFLPYQEMLNAIKNGINIITYHPVYQLKNIDVYEVLDLFESHKLQNNDILLNSSQLSNVNISLNVKGDNYGHIGGEGHSQMNLKIKFTDDEKYEQLKEQILHLQEYEAEDLKWKELLSQAIYELNKMESADTLVQQKASSDKVDFIFKKLKNLKDWVAITLLPGEIASKGEKMIEIWDKIKQMLS